MPRKKTIEEFIQQAQQVYGDKYDYSKVNYVDTHTKVCMICPEHGEFWQTPSNHMKYGCILCGGTHKMDTEEFISKATALYGNKYDYSKVLYETTRTKVIIICPTHGAFTQTPHDHLRGHGCPICGGVFTYTTESFIEAARKVHGDIYNYDKVNYTNSTNKVIITCTKHGEFLQAPAGHLSGAGCAKCKRSRGEEAVAITLETLGLSFEEQYRIDVDSEVRNCYIADFYIPSKNCIIEFNGEQHYRPMRFFGGEPQLIKQQVRDEGLRAYCTSKNIKLIEIPYYENNIKEFIIKSLM